MLPLHVEARFAPGNATRRGDARQPTGENVMPTDLAAACPYRPGDAVRVDASTACPVADAAVFAGRWAHRVNITGYSGVVTSARAVEDGHWQVTLEWDTQTFLRVSSAWLRFWAWRQDGDMQFGYTTLDSRRLQRIAPVDSAAQRAEARRGIRLDLRRMKALQDLYDAAGAPPSRRADGRVQATVLRYVPSADEQGFHIVESPCLEDFLLLSAQREMRFFGGSRRHDHRAVGVARSRRALDHLRPRCAETARVILEWFEAGGLTEAEVLVAMQPWPHADGIPAFTPPA